MEAIKTSLFRRLASATAALGISCLTAYASPAGAETITLFCTTSAIDSYTVDIDYVAGTIALEYKSEGRPQTQWGPGAAVITDRAVTFKLSVSKALPQSPGSILLTLEGNLDRIAGTLALIHTNSYLGPEFSSSSQGRCVRATQKF